MLVNAVRLTFYDQIYKLMEGIIVFTVAVSDRYVGFH